LSYFKDEIITIYSICYDGDPDRIYTFTCFDKAIASIEGSIRDYYGSEDEDEQFDQFCVAIRNRLIELKKINCIPLKFDNLRIILYSWELDRTNPLHNIVSRCYEIIKKSKDEKLLRDIESLFKRSVIN
jgi:hypothetical protein